ncbi:putative lipid kinase YtlR [subsurface metagenome]
MLKKRKDYSWLIIVNPNAGLGRGKKDWDCIDSLLKKHKISYQTEFTKARKHAIELTARGIRQGFRNIVAVGGDGTMNEVVNGCFNQNICRTQSLTLSMIAVGTGNDWGKMFSIPASYEEAIVLIKNKSFRLQDIGVVEFCQGAKIEKRYFINIAGLGFDALVVKKTNDQKDKGKGGNALYFWNLLKCLMSYRPTLTHIIIDGQKINNELFTMSLGIGKYSGGGMMQTPNAVPDDGLFDITLIKKMRKGEIIRNLKKLYDGSILEHPKIEGYTGKVIHVDADPVVHAEADGESLGHSPVEFKIIPKSINIVYGNYPEQ